MMVADLKFNAPLHDADWIVSADDRVQVLLSLALTKHVPGWPGATDEQLYAVSQAIIDGLDTDRINTNI